NAIRAACKFCQENPCGCPREIKEIRIELEEEEEKHRYALMDYKCRTFSYIAGRILPWYKLSKYIYLSIGGRQNLVPAVLISTNVTQLIFHYFLPRLIFVLHTRKKCS